MASISAASLALGGAGIINGVRGINAARNATALVKSLPSGIEAMVPAGSRTIWVSANASRAAVTHERVHVAVNATLGRAQGYGISNIWTAVEEIAAESIATGSLRAGVGWFVSVWDDYLTLGKVAGDLGAAAGVGLSLYADDDDCDD